MSRNCIYTKRDSIENILFDIRVKAHEREHTYENCYVNDEVVKQLRELGYVVSNHRYSYATISW